MDAQKYLLINPTSPFLVDERGLPPLGILKVASSLLKRGVPVAVLDVAGYNQQTVLRLTCEAAEVSRATHIGITATTPQFPSAVHIARTLRKTRPDARIVLGGPHANSVVAALRLEKKEGRTHRGHAAYQQLEAEFDQVVVGDGEEAVFETLKPEMPRLLDADGRSAPLSKYFLTDAALSESPFPARHLVDLDTYHFYIDGERATSIVSQYGCPFNCGFCGLRNAAVGRNIRKRSTESVIREIEEILDSVGYRAIMFYDDELNVDRKRTLRLMDELHRLQKRRGVKLRFRGFVKAELFDEEIAEAMVKAGFSILLTGFESGADRILTNINKKATKAQNTKCVSIAHRFGMKVKALMSAGHPGDSSDTMRETQDWLIDNLQEGDDFDCTVITPYPGSPYYDGALPSEEKEGEWVYTFNGDSLYQLPIDYSQKAQFYKGIPGQYVSYVYTPYLSPSELVAARDKLEMEVRTALRIPFPAIPPEKSYEHSMGQGLPDKIYREGLPR